MFGVPLKHARRILFVGAHADDIEIGCGATVLRLVEQLPRAEFTWVVLSGEGVRKQEAQASADAFLAKAKRRRVVVEQFRTSFFPYDGERIKAFFETLKACRPDVVFTHYRQDLHQDHRVVSELTWNTFRSHLVLEYEIPKYDGDLGAPNFFVPVTEAQLARKCRLLREHFASQSTKHWFTDDLFRALPRLRGIECDSPDRYAEAFYARKVVLG